MTKMTEETIAKIRQAEQEADRLEQDAADQAVQIEKENEKTIEKLYADAKKDAADYAEKCRTDAEEKANKQEQELLKEAEESFASLADAGKAKLPEVAAAIYAHLVK